MSSPRYDWWPSAIRMIRNDPARRAEHDDLMSQSVVADLSGMPHGEGESRPVEQIATREMAPALQQEYEAVTKALEITRLLPTGKEREKMIRQMYWGREKRPISSVVYQLHIAEVTGKRWHADFVRLVGVCFGYIQ